MTDLQTEAPRPEGGGTGVTSHRFVILAHGRSGSNWLVDLLNSHPNCSCKGELFLVGRGSPERDADPLGFLEARLTKAAQQPGTTHVGFKHLPNFNDSVTAAVVADPRYRVIILTRRNRLAQYASQTLAEQTDHWVNVAGTAQGESQLRVPFVVRDFIDYCQNTDRWFAPEARRLRALGRPALEITYEELEAGVAQPRVLAFLGLDPIASLTSSHRRINSENTYERFENPRRARILGPLVQWRPTRKLLRILRGIRPLRPWLD